METENDVLRTRALEHAVNMFNWIDERYATPVDAAAGVSALAEAIYQWLKSGTVAVSEGVSE